MKGRWVGRISPDPYLTNIYQYSIHYFFFFLSYASSLSCHFAKVGGTDGQHSVVEIIVDVWIKAKQVKYLTSVILMEGSAKTKHTYLKNRKKPACG